jgi:hypothetical protein
MDITDTNKPRIIGSVDQVRTFAGGLLGNLAEISIDGGVAITCWGIVE